VAPIEASPQLSNGAQDVRNREITARQSDIARFLVLGRTAVATGIAGVISSKLIATRGPQAVGSLALVAAIAGFVTFCCDLNVGQSLLRSASADFEGSYPERAWSAVYQARRITRTGAATVCVIALGAVTLFGDGLGVSTAMLLSGAGGGALSMLTAQAGNALSAGRRIRQRTNALLAQSFLTPVIIAISVWKLADLSWTLVATALSGFLTMYFVGRPYPKSTMKVARTFVRSGEQRRTLLREGSVLTIASLPGNIVVSTLPFAIGYILDTSSVGFHRMIVTISMTYMSLFTLALSSDFLPRVAAKLRDPAVLLDRQMNLLLSAFAPIAAVLTGLGPEIVRIAFSDKFLVATNAFQIYVLGDVFRICAWTIGTAFIAALGPSAILRTETLGALGATLAMTISLWLVRTNGIGWGHLAGYLMWSAALVPVARRRLGWRPSLLLKKTVFRTLVCAVSPAIVRNTLGLGAGISVTAVAALVALFSFFRVGGDAV
jgi:O-antigen/teichoic acid export membrane protein